MLNKIILRISQKRYVDIAAHIGILALLASYLIAFSIKGLLMFYETRIDFTRATIILNEGIKGFYSHNIHLSPYPPLALILITAFRILLPKLELFKIGFLFLHLSNWLLYYFVLRRRDKKLAPLIYLVLLTFPFLRSGLLTLYPTDHLFLLFLLLALLFYQAGRRILSYSFMGLSIITKWYSVWASILIPCYLYIKGKKKEALEFTMIVWSLIFIGLILPIAIFPNYIEVLFFHLEKHAKVIQYVSYSYGLTIPVINVPEPYTGLVGALLMVCTVLLFTVMVMRGKEVSYFSLIAFALIFFAVFAVSKQPELRLCVPSLLATCLSISRGKEFTLLTITSLLFFFRYGFLPAITALFIMMYMLYKAK